LAGRADPEMEVGPRERWPMLGDLLRRRAELLRDFAADDGLWGGRLRRLHLPPPAVGPPDEVGHVRAGAAPGRPRPPKLLAGAGPAGQRAGQHELGERPGVLEAGARRLAALARDDEVALDPVLRPRQHPLRLAELVVLLLRQDARVVAVGLRVHDAL